MKCDRHWILAAGCWILPHLNMSRESCFRFWEKRSGGDWENSQITPVLPFSPPPGMRRRPLQNAKVCKQPATSIQQPVSSSQYQGRRGHLRWELDIDRLHICTLAHFRAKRAGTGLVSNAERQRGGEAESFLVANSTTDRHGRAALTLAQPQKRRALAKPVRESPWLTTFSTPPLPSPGRRRRPINSLRALRTLREELTIWGELRD